MKDLKYSVAYLAPIMMFAALYFGGVWSFSAVILAFVIIPLLEAFLPGTEENFSEAEEEKQNNKFIFDFMLYSNVPMVWSLLLYFFYVLSTSDLLWWEIMGMTMSTGVMLGYSINVAHEMGHRHTFHERLMSKMLLLPSHYLHFSIEHNLGHHKNVSTDKDPASSRFNETIYAFYFRSVWYSFLSAWNIESKRLSRAKKGFWTMHNQMIWFQLIQISYLSLVYIFFGPMVLVAAIIAGILGFLLLESVNYIEHYGLRRKKLPNGKYEPVQPYHSWNSNHEIGRIFLYELTRHSDHHFKATRKYQVLRHFEESPQLPYGYPGSIILAMFPPLWFHVMNPQVLQYVEAEGANVSLALA